MSLLTKIAIMYAACGFRWTTGCMIKRNNQMRSTIGTKFLRTLIAAGYLLMCLLAVGIMYLWFYEWKEIEALETENRRINAFRQEVHLVYGK